MGNTSGSRRKSDPAGRRRADKAKSAGPLSGGASGSDELLHGEALAQPQRAPSAPGRVVSRAAPGAPDPEAADQPSPWPVRPGDPGPTPPPAGPTVLPLLGPASPGARPGPAARAAQASLRSAGSLLESERGGPAAVAGATNEDDGYYRTDDERRSFEAGAAAAAATAGASPSAARRFGREDVKRGQLIGQGAYGKVYYCMDRRTGELIAAKVVPLNVRWVSEPIFRSASGEEGPDDAGGGSGGTGVGAGGAGAFDPPLRGHQPAQSGASSLGPPSAATSPLSSAGGEPLAGGASRGGLSLGAAAPSSAGAPAAAPAAPSPRVPASRLPGPAELLDGSTHPLMRRLVRRQTMAAEAAARARREQEQARARLDDAAAMDRRLVAWRVRALMNDETTALVRDLEGEIALMASLDHRNIVRYLGFRKDRPHLELLRPGRTRDTALVRAEAAGVRAAEAQAQANHFEAASLQPRRGRQPGAASALTLTQSSDRPGRLARLRQREEMLDGHGGLVAAAPGAVPPPHRPRVAMVSSSSSEGVRAAPGTTRPGVAQRGAGPAPRASGSSGSSPSMMTSSDEFSSREVANDDDDDDDGGPGAVQGRPGGAPGLGHGSPARRDLAQSWDGTCVVPAGPAPGAAADASVPPGARRRRRRHRRQGQSTVTIFMELVPGGSVRAVLDQVGRLPERLVRVYTRQLLQGLTYLHAHRIVHRDIKGANLLVNGQSSVKVADFGASSKLASLADPSAASTSIRGTPLFMAPEVIQQVGHGRKADVWSAGCTVIEMASGRPPWASLGFDNEVAAMFHIATTETPPDLPADMSPVARDFVLRCLTRDPAARPTAHELLVHPFVASTSRSGPLLRTLTPPFAPHPPLSPPASRQLPAAPSFRTAAGLRHSVDAAGDSTPPPPSPTALGRVTPQGRPPSHATVAHALRSPDGSFAESTFASFRTERVPALSGSGRSESRLSSEADPMNLSDRDRPSLGGDENGREGGDADRGGDAAHTRPDGRSDTQASLAAAAPFEEEVVGEGEVAAADATLPGGRPPALSLRPDPDLHPAPHHGEGSRLAESTTACVTMPTSARGPFPGGEPPWGWPAHDDSPRPAAAARLSEAQGGAGEDATQPVSGAQPLLSRVSAASRRALKLSSHDEDEDDDEAEAEAAAREAGVSSVVAGFIRGRLQGLRRGGDADMASIFQRSFLVGDLREDGAAGGQESPPTPPRPSGVVVSALSPADALVTVKEHASSSSSDEESERAAQPVQPLAAAPSDDGGSQQDSIRASRSATPGLWGRWGASFRSTASGGGPARAISLPRMQPARSCKESACTETLLPPPDQGGPSQGHSRAASGGTSALVVGPSTVTGRAGHAGGANADLGWSVPSGDSAASGVSSCRATQVGEAEVVLMEGALRGSPGGSPGSRRAPAAAEPAYRAGAPTTYRVIPATLDGAGHLRRADAAGPSEPDTATISSTTMRKEPCMTQRPAAPERCGGAF